MKDKAIFKKWWFWLAIVVIVLGVIGAVSQPADNDETNAENSAQSNPLTDDNNSSVTDLPLLNSSDYEGKEGLIVYKELKAKGYAVDAEFESEVLTDINGKASSVFEPLDVNSTEDRQSVDAFVIKGLEQTGSDVKLVVVKSSN